MAKTPEVFGYDLDGNLTNDGRWSYTWDAENRLVSLTNNTTVGPQQLIKFEYDAKGRRIHKQVWTGGALTTDVRFLYDGWNLIAELASNNSLIRSYVWGSDLSGSMQGAGGVGGLLEAVYYGSATTNCLAAYDGNGNVAALVNAADGTTLANYEYGPFGEVIRATGPMAKNNPIRFSTKFQDDESDLVYYGYRYYGASTGRWLSRDLIAENGGMNLYGSVANNPVNENDPLGLCNIKIRCNPVVEGIFTVGWHCGVIGPDGQTYELGGVGIAGSSGGTPVIYPILGQTNQPPPPPHYIEYPVSCNGCCASLLTCIKNFTAAARQNPPTYFALGPNSNTYAHKMLDKCSCSVNPIQLPCYTVLRSPKEGGPYTVCPSGTTTTPPGAVAW